MGKIFVELPEPVTVEEKPPVVDKKPAKKDKNPVAKMPGEPKSKSKEPTGLAWRAKIKKAVSNLQPGLDMKKILLAAGIVVVVALGFVLISNAGRYKKMSCKISAENLPLNEGGEYDYDASYALDFEDDKLVKATVDRAYRAGNHDTLVALKYGSDILIKASEYTDEVDSEMDEEEFRTHYVLPLEVFNLPPKIFGKRNIGEMLEIEDWGEDWTVGVYLTYERTKENYNAKGFICE